MFLYISMCAHSLPLSKFPDSFFCLFQMPLAFCIDEIQQKYFYVYLKSWIYFNIYGWGGGIWRNREMIASFNSPSSWNPFCRKIFESESPRYLWVLGVYTETVWYNHSMTFSGREFNRRANSRYGIQFIHTWLGKMSRNWYDIIIYACNSI